MAKLTADWSIEVSHLSAGDEFEVTLEHKACRAIATIAHVSRYGEINWPLLRGEPYGDYSCECDAPYPARQLIEFTVRTYAERLAERIERDRGMP